MGKIYIKSFEKSTWKNAAGIQGEKTFCTENIDVFP